MYVYIHVCIHTYIYTDSWMCNHTYLQAYKLNDMKTCINMYIHGGSGMPNMDRQTLMVPYKHGYINTSFHTSYIAIYTYIHTYI